MNPPLVLIPVEPIGSHESMAFCNPPAPGRGSLRNVTTLDYPPHPCGEALRLLSMRCDLGLREMACVLALRPSDVSALEFGRATLSAEDWCRVFRAIDEDWHRRHPVPAFDGGA